MQILARNVYRDRNWRYAVVDPAPYTCASLLPDERIKLENKAVLLENGNKVARGDHSLSGVLPAGKCLRADYLSRFNRVLGLEVHHKFTVQQRFVHIILDSLLFLQLGLHIGIVEPDIFKRVSLYELTGKRRIIAVPSCVNCSVVHDRNAEYQAVFHILISAQHTFHLVDKRDQIVLCFKCGHYHKYVRGKAAEGLFLGADDRQ